MHGICGTHSSKPEGALWQAPENLSGHVYNNLKGPRPCRNILLKGVILRMASQGLTPRVARAAAALLVCLPLLPFKELLKQGVLVLCAHLDAIASSGEEFLKVAPHIRRH